MLSGMEYGATTMANLQVKGIDDDLYRALKARAERNRRSVSQEVVRLIERHLFGDGGEGRRPAAAVIELAGTWEDERSAAEIARDIRKGRRRSRKRERVVDVLD